MEVRILLALASRKECAMSETKVSEKASKLVFDVSTKSMQRAAWAAGIGEITRMNEAIQKLLDYIASLERNVQ